MIKGKGTIKGRETLIIGLSYKNLENLKRDDDFIMILKEEINIPFDILIFAKEDEKALVATVTGPNTVVTGSFDPPRKN
jgi:hypothetical protein